MAQTNEMKSAETKIQTIGRKLLMGLKVVDVRYMLDEEMDEIGWTQKSIVIHFDDGTIIYCSQDDEGNNAGALFYQTPRAEKVKEFQLGVLPVIR
jgi:hypothetical protein